METLGELFTLPEITFAPWSKKSWKIKFGRGHARTKNRESGLCSVVELNDDVLEPMRPHELAMLLWTEETMPSVVEFKKDGHHHRYRLPLPCTASRAEASDMGGACASWSVTIPAGISSIQTSIVSSWKLIGSIIKAFRRPAGEAI